MRFERASVRVSAKSLLRGKLDITDMEVDGLAVVSRSAAAKTAPAAAPASSARPRPPVSDKNEAKDAARLEAVLTRILTVAPNALTVRDGHVSLLRSDGASTEFSHVDLNLKNVRPGADTGLTLKADIRGWGRHFRRPGIDRRSRPVRLEPDRIAAQGRVYAYGGAAVRHAPVPERRRQLPIAQRLSDLAFPDALRPRSARDGLRRRRRFARSVARSSTCRRSGLPGSSRPRDRPAPFCRAGPSRARLRSRALTAAALTGRLTWTKAY